MLSTTSQYALRALCHLARQSGEAVLGRDLAQAVEIPANYLSKVLLTLRNAGLVDTSRGSGGGYRLRKPADQISLIDVVELFEEISRTRPSCFLGRTRLCSETTPCTAHSTDARSTGGVFGISYINPAFRNRRKTGRSLDELQCRHASH
jgi:Rrf2 family protein